MKVVRGDCDVAIVGGGISGLYAAWRLGSDEEKNKWCHKSTLLLEANSECGGRLRTIQHPALGYTANMGAMRYLPDQYLINGLVSEFSTDLTSYPFIYPTAFWYLRAYRMYFGKQDVTKILGKRFRRDRPIANRGLYLVAHSDEFGKEPAEIVELALRKALIQVGKEPGTMASLIHEDVDPNKAQDLCRQLTALDERTGPNGELKPLKFSLFTPEQWDWVRKCGYHRGVPLYMQSLWDLLHKNCSAEAYRLVQDGLGYQGIVGLWNAAEAMVWFIREFESASGYKAIEKGMQVITHTLRRKARLQPVSNPAQKGANSRSYCVNSKVRRIDFDERTGDFVLRIEHGTQANQNKSTEVLYEVTCRRLILAIPAGALEKIIWGPGLKKRVRPSADKTEVKQLKESLRVRPSAVKTEVEQLKESLRLVNRHPLLKFFVWFDKPWWSGPEDTNEDFDEESGTDEPLPQLPDELKDALANLSDRQIQMIRKNLRRRESFVKAEAFKVYTDSSLRQLYFYSGQRDRLSETTEATMMVYPDDSHANYWRSVAHAYQDDGTEGPSANPEDDKGRRWEFYHKIMLACERKSLSLSPDQQKSLKEIIQKYGITPPFWSRVVDYLVDLFPGLRRSEIEQCAVFGALRDWMEPPFYAGWHSWSVGCKPWEVRKSLRCPFQDLPIYVCGEAFSVEQGWCEGALRSTEAILKQGFDLAEPSFGGIDPKQMGKFKNFEHYVNY